MCYVLRMEHPVAQLFSPEEVTEVDPGGQRAAHHRMLLRCALLLHRHDSWTGEQIAIWTKAVGVREVSARALCEAIRKSGITVSV